jgi:hypothetical protein
VTRNIRQRLQKGDRVVIPLMSLHVPIDMVDTCTMLLWTLEKASRTDDRVDWFGPSKSSSWADFMANVITRDS